MSRAAAPAAINVGTRASISCSIGASLTTNVAHTDRQHAQGSLVFFLNEQRVRPHPLCPPQFECDRRVVRERTTSTFKFIAGTQGFFRVVDRDLSIPP